MGDDTYGYAYDPICSGIVTAESTETTEHLANAVTPYTNILCVPASLRLTREADGNPTLHDASCNRNGACMPGNRYACYAANALFQQTPSGCFTYAFDQAKNVTELFDSAGGIAAAYDHGPFGEDMAAAGPAAGLNPFRFSSEVWDGALGLVCYTFRPYNPLDGRFLSRDPIGEQGGLNLYGFVGNDPVNVIDSLGLESYSIFYGAGPADGVASIAKAAEQVRTYMAKFQPDDDKNDNMICMVKIENNISSSRLRWASTVYNELFFFGHGRKDTRINPNWKTGQPLKEREQIVGTNIMFSDGLFHLDKVLTEEKEKITASIIYPYVCYDEFVSEGNPSGIKVCKLANNPNPNPSAIGNMTLITLMLEKFKTKKCCRLEIQ